MSGSKNISVKGYLYLSVGGVNIFCGSSSNCCKCSTKPNEEYSTFDDISVVKTPDKQTDEDFELIIDDKMNNVKANKFMNRDCAQFDEEINEFYNLKNKLNSNITTNIDVNNKHFTKENDETLSKKSSINIEINDGEIKIENYNYTKLEINKANYDKIIGKFFDNVVNLYLINDITYDSIKNNLHNISVIFKSIETTLPYLLAIVRNDNKNYLLFCKNANTRLSNKNLTKLSSTSLFDGTKNNEIIIIQNGALEDISNMFNSCTVEYLDLGNFNTSTVTNFGCMFFNCNNLKKIDLTNLDTRSATNMRCIFYKCINLSEIRFGNRFDTSKVTDMSYMFDSCNNLKELDISNFSSTNILKANYMFYGCSNLNQLIIGDNFHITNSAKKNILENCDNLKNIYIDITKNNSFDELLRDKYEYNKDTKSFTKKD